MATKTPVYIQPNTRYEGEMPYSEVCVSMGVAGKRMGFILRRVRYMNGKEIPPDKPARMVVQLYEGLREFSSPILTGEAGLYEDSQGFYYYPPIEN